MKVDGSTLLDLNMQGVWSCSPITACRNCPHPEDDLRVQIAVIYGPSS